jgi:hypothetical protein
MAARKFEIQIRIFTIPAIPLSDFCNDETTLHLFYGYRTSAIYRMSKQRLEELECYINVFMLKRLASDCAFQNF